MSKPAVSLSLLHRADGSAAYVDDEYNIICAVNGPIEVQRRDEIPNEAALEINIRPASGTGCEHCPNLISPADPILLCIAAKSEPATKERHFETVIQKTLRQIILVQNFPRSLIQLTFQIISVPERPTGRHADSVRLPGSFDRPLNDHFAVY
jgi:exosome complex component RRP46